jgi:RimJ/RimL family protein N-acetyltransferase
MAMWNGTELDGLVLQAGTLTLRPWQPSDASEVSRLMADERVGRYLDVPRPYRPSDAAEFIAGAGVAGRRDGSRIDCAIVRNVDGALLGSARLGLTASGGEIGYWVGAEYWRQRVATEAVRTLSRFGFAHGLFRIQITCDLPNVASAGVALKAGYRYEGVARAGRLRRGEPVDLAVFGRLPVDDGEPVEPSWPPLPDLSDGVVGLRPVRPEDWPTVLAEASNPESVGWGFTGKPMSEATARQRAASSGLDGLVNRWVELLIYDVATGTGAGTMSLRRVGPPGVIALGYGIVPEFRGRRFTTRALRLISDWALDSIAVRLELGCKQANIASARSAEAAGFVIDAHHPSRLRNPDGSYSDEIGYCKIR